ncbi:TetR/AcrR family transcriptional regulator [Pseudonocardia sp. MH-G8]|uniref:TetR/AcrR family transcriptional regulator n=1 Tax=Pseudonocardia sp. MH-G8 TaxID=1854588 RepID=UPI000BA1864E|nr:TetR/AcrR family transcriptional regulator [Pseudonocardia sp. MH-G8]OZM82056.1 TetR family transcriptional regulator [Pseudonocardia sp. MH-G8]
MTSPGPGRPRHTGPLRPGATGREQILDAAAELFTTHGYARTSTRAIAEAVGIRQASLYHHFRTKDDVLEALLTSTVTPTLPVAHAVLRVPAGDAEHAAARLYALALHDGRELCRTRWNLGALYLLPELRAPRFVPFQTARERLRQCYVRAGADVVARTGGPSQAGDLAFRLVESLVNLRADGRATADSPAQVAEGCVRLACWSGDVTPVARSGEEMLRDISAALLVPAG